MSLNIGTFDFETDPFKHGREPKPFLGGVFDGSCHSDWWGPDCAEKVCEYLLKHPRIWYAHNGGKFDFHLLIKYIPRKRIKRMLTIGGRIVQISFHGKEQCEFRDSYALIPRPLRDWCKDDIKIDKLESDVREKHKAEITHYHKGDKEHLFEMLSTFIESYGMHLTLASAAFKILHKNFHVERTHISEAQDAFFRKYYFAGRVEFYGLGNLGGPFTCLDVNSSFPWSMTQNHWEGDGFLSMSREPKKFLEQSFFRLTCDSHGAFPLREEDGGVSFPGDGKRREFYVTGWEYKAARDLGLLVRAEIISAYMPLKVRNYADYVNHFYAIKERAESVGDKGERLFAKLLLNGSYGKYGADPRSHEEVMLCDWRQPPDPEGWHIQKDDEKNNITIYARPAKGMHTKFNNVCVAASVTGCSRALLLRARQKCRGVAYCDTDSLVAQDVSQLPVGKKLGEWKVENIFSEFHVGGKKLYAGHYYDSKGISKWKTASKGARLTADEIVRVAAGEEINFSFDAPSYSVKSILPESDGGKKGATKWLRFTSRTIRRADKMKNAKRNTNAVRRVGKN
jgi:hypothetical protein